MRKTFYGDPNSFWLSIWKNIVTVLERQKDYYCANKYILYKNGNSNWWITFVMSLRLCMVEYFSENYIFYEMKEVGPRNVSFVLVGK